MCIRDSLKAGRIVDLTHLVHPGIQRCGPFPAMRTEPRYTVAESGFHVEQVSCVTQYGTHVDAPEHFVEGRRTLERIELEERGVTAVGHETLDTDGSADVRARGARLREVRARVQMCIRDRLQQGAVSQDAFLQGEGCQSSPDSRPQEAHRHC